MTTWNQEKLAHLKIYSKIYTILPQRVFLCHFFIRISIICLDLFVYLPVSVDFVRMDLDAVGVKGNDVFVSGVLWDITEFHFIKNSKKK